MRRGLTRLLRRVTLQCTWRLRVFTTKLNGQITETDIFNTIFGTKIPQESDKSNQ